MSKINKQRPDPILGRYWIWLGLFVLWTSSVGWASALQWEHTDIRLSAREGDEKVEVSYPVKNVGSQTVKVTSIETGCGCTSAQLSDQRLLPGEKGELKVVFKLEGRVGPQSKVITIKTDEEANGTTQLWLRIDIVSPVVILPRMLFWRVGDAVEAKTVSVTLTAGDDIKLREVTCNSADFTATWGKAKTSGGMRLMIKPVQTAKQSQAQINVGVEVGGVLRIITLYAYVK